MAMTTTAMMSQRISWPIISPDMDITVPPYAPYRGSSAPTSADNALEPARLFRQRDFCRQALHRRRTVKAVATGCSVQDEFGILGRGDGATMDQNDRLRIDFERRFRPGLDEGRALRQLERGRGTDAAARRKS